MASPSPPSSREDLRKDFERELRRRVATLGPGGLDREALVRAFVGQVPRATLYRWINKALESGLPGQELARAVEAHIGPPADVDRAEARAAGEPPPPPMPSVVHAAEAISHPVPVFEHMKRCINAAEQVIKWAEGDPQGIGLKPKTLLAASEHLRRCMETLVRIQEAVNGVQQIEAMHAAILEEIAKESPDTARRITARLKALSMTWGAPA